MLIDCKISVLFVLLLSVVQTVPHPSTWIRMRVGIPDTTNYKYRPLHPSNIRFIEVDSRKIPPVDSGEYFDITFKTTKSSSSSGGNQNLAGRNDGSGLAPGRLKVADSKKHEYKSSSGQLESDEVGENSADIINEGRTSRLENHGNGIKTENERNSVSNSRAMENNEHAETTINSGKTSAKASNSESQEQKSLVKNSAGKHNYEFVEKSHFGSSKEQTTSELKSLDSDLEERMIPDKRPPCNIGESYADETDRRHYYQCYKVTHGYRKIRLKCSVGRYNDREGRCTWQS